MLLSIVFVHFLLCTSYSQVASDSILAQPSNLVQLNNPVKLQFRAMDRKVLALEATRDLTHVWAHVDMDAFYASCEELADPSLVSWCMHI